MGEKGREEPPGQANGIGEGLGWEDRPAVPLSLTKRGVGEAGSA